MINLAIFASGNGSNAERLIQHFQDHSQVRICTVFCNRKHAGVFDRLHGVEGVYVPKATWLEQPDKLLSMLRTRNIHFIVLAGFLLKVPQQLIQVFPERIINIHPSLLPKFGGKGMYGMHVHEAVAAANEKLSGISIHAVNEEFDKGRIIYQASCEVAGLTAKEIAKKVQTLEHRFFAPAIEQYVLTHEYAKH